MMSTDELLHHARTGERTTVDYMILAQVAPVLIGAVRDGATEAVAAEATRRVFSGRLPFDALDAEVRRVLRTFDFDDTIIPGDWRTA